MTQSKSQDCEYGYHRRLTFAYGDGFFDTWTCDECGEEICLGELQNYAAAQMTRFWLRAINDEKQIEILAKLPDDRGRLSRKLLELMKER